MQKKRSLRSFPLLPGLLGAAEVAKIDFQVDLIKSETAKAAVETEKRD